MSHDFLQFAPRRPRYAAMEAGRLCAALQATRNATTEAWRVALRDFSRGGFSVLLEEPLDVGTPVTLELFDERSGHELSVAGTVRWRTPERSGAWLIGCQAAEEVEWADLGELFLSAALSPDAQPRGSGD